MRVPSAMNGELVWPDGVEATTRPTRPAAISQKWTPSSTASARRPQRHHEACSIDAALGHCVGARRRQPGSGPRRVGHGGAAPVVDGPSHGDAAARRRLERRRSSRPRRCRRPAGPSTANRQAPRHGTDRRPVMKSGGSRRSVFTVPTTKAYYRPALPRVRNREQKIVSAAFEGADEL